ncbi:MAG: hypothetical protein N3D76_06400 [Geminocystis sp.]|nr:hypothetical protein [Geminocystis sp.]
MKYLYYILKHINRVTNNRPEDTEEEGGYVLVLALALVVGLSTLVAQYARLTRLEQLSATASSIDANTALYVAEAVANERAAQLRRIYQLQNTPTGTPPESISNCLQNTTTGRGTGDFACQTKLFPPPAPGRSGYIGVSYVVPGSSRTITVPAGQAFAGTTALEYTHSVYALAYKEVDAGTKQLGNNTKASAVLQMDVRTRLVPMFQFAAFYREDLEILPGPQMVLNGPVHTNGDLYLGSGNLLRIRGLVSTLRDIYNRRKNDGSTYAEGRVQIDNSAGTAINLLSGGTGSTNPTTNPMDPDRVRQTWGGRVRVRMQEPIQVPTATGIFDKANGDYWRNADLRIIFTPRSTANNNYRRITNNNFPFDITVIKRNPDGSVNSTYSLTNEQKMSLLQPVLVGADLANIPANVTVGSTNVTNPFHICTPVRVENSNRTVSPALRLGNTTYSQLGQWYQALNVTQKNAVRTVAQDWLLKEIHHANSNVAIRYSLLDIPVKDVKSQDGNLYNNFATNPSNSLNNNPTLVGAFPDSQDRQGAINAIENMTAQEIAGLAQYQGTGSGSEVPGTRRCFAPAPITDVGRDAANHDTPYRFYNHREEKDLRLLQLNLESLVVWNRDGVYRDPGGGGGGGNNTHLVSANQLLFDRAPADNNAPGHSFQRLGLAARDTSHGGLVFYATMGNSTTWTPRQSPFGFAIVNGEQLPGLGTTQTYPDPTGLTFVSDQALYVQGDYNVNTRDYHTGASENLSSPRGENEFVTRPANKQPAAFLVDTFTPLSNACINSDRTVFHAQLPVSSIPSNDRAISCSGHRDQLPKHTEFNAALLAGTDITNAPGYGYNGGLENYPRFLEDWTGREWRYRGSFVSLGIPINVSGAWGKANVYSPPLRPWDYDQDFNDARNLPPMTPQFVYLIQEAFIRSYSQPGQ